MDWPLKFGIFLAPFHPVGQNPTLALERDLDLSSTSTASASTRRGSASTTPPATRSSPAPRCSSPTAAERTKHIRLGTGVSSLPYHHPLMLADRMVLLDHLTRGRVMLGVGPGALPSDAFMMGIPVAEQRDRMEEALEAILLLLRSDEPVTMKTDWFTLDDARLQLRPYTHPHFEVAVAAQVSPSGPRAAGRFGTRLLSIGATNQQGFDLLGYHWEIAEERAAEFGTSVDRRNWRLVGPMHIAETKEQAYADVAVRPGRVGRLLPAGRRAAPRAGHVERGRDGRRDQPVRASRSSARPTTPSRRSSGCGTSPTAASARSSSWRTTGPTPPRPAGATSCWPATCSPRSRARRSRRRRRATGPPRTARRSSARPAPRS